MAAAPDFQIISSDAISTEFVNRNILTFSQAALFVRQLPYGRNSNKNDLTTVFLDNCGTCSTKHALLKQLAYENNCNELRLTVGLFKMNGENTAAIATTLEQHNLQYIPEAHCYLKYNDLILDYTKSNSKPSDFIDDLIEEMEIAPNQITDYKVAYHKNYLTDWLDKTERLHLTLDELWTIREQCIQDLADN